VGLHTPVAVPPIVGGRSDEGAAVRVRALRGAAGCLWLDGVGFGVFVPFGIWSVSTGRGVPEAFGYPTYGGGPFEDYGIPTSTPLLLAYLLVCGLEVVAGRLLWDGRRSGAVLGLALVPVGAVFWWGFALPAGPVLALLRCGLIGYGWPALRR
jgi:hypothetical protein